MNEIALSSIEELRNFVETLKIQKCTLRRQHDLGIISEADMVKEIAMITSREKNIKWQLVDQIHITRSGKKRSMITHGPTKFYPKGYVYTCLKGGKIIKAKDLDTLYERLYEHYYESTAAKCMVKKIFDMALEEKKDTENPNQSTVARYVNDFKRFIDEEMAACDIRGITDLDLKHYTQELVHRKKMTKASFLAYKGVLNLIFRYAYNHGVIFKNPVLTINNRIYLKSCDCRKPTAEEKIFSVEEIGRLKEEIVRRMESGKYGAYYSFGYAMNFAILTGVRSGELCALKWEDIDFGNLTIHIHSQQLLKHEDGHIVYYMADYTKNEKGISQDGRLFPITDELLKLLNETRQAQKKAGLDTEFVFGRTNGKPMNIHAYTRFLRRICEKVGLSITNNHAFRMALNSNVFIPNGIPETVRAQLLGHSVETNLSYYSFAQRDYLASTREKLNAVQNIDGGVSAKMEEFGVIRFTQRKSPQTLSLKAFS